MVGRFAFGDPRYRAKCIGCIFGPRSDPNIQLLEGQTTQNLFACGNRKHENAHTRPESSRLRFAHSRRKTSFAQDRQQYTKATCVPQMANFLYHTARAFVFYANVRSVWSQSRVITAK